MTLSQTEMSFLSKKALAISAPSRSTVSNQDTWIKRIIGKSNDKSEETGRKIEKGGR
jgi:hypothetical protein